MRHVPALNHAGGLLCLWEEGSFQILKCVAAYGYLFLQGVWKGCNEVINLINVYSPCSLIDKRSLWANLVQLKKDVGGGIWCVVRDFNTVYRKEEQMDRLGGSQQ